MLAMGSENEMEAGKVDELGPPVLPRPPGAD
jgi:hypothetical protein